MYIPPTGNKICFAPCPEGVPCECRARILVDIMKCDEQLGLYDLPSSDQNLEESDTTEDASSSVAG
jgi:hypothetical protein